jgi:hypothetical protein
VGLKHVKVDAHYSSQVTMPSRWLQTIRPDEPHPFFHFLSHQVRRELITFAGDRGLVRGWGEPKLEMRLFRPSSQVLADANVSSTPLERSGLPDAGSRMQGASSPGSYSGAAQIPSHLISPGCWWPMASHLKHGERAVTLRRPEARLFAWF